jgi:hypothetical protein
MSRLQIFPLVLQLDPIRPNGPSSYHLRNLCPLTALLTALILILLISPFHLRPENYRAKAKGLLALPSRRNRCATAAGTGNFSSFMNA